MRALKLLSRSLKNGGRNLARCVLEVLKKPIKEDGLTFREGRVATLLLLIY